MKMKIEVECTPQEARAFLGLPDVTALNEQLTAEMAARMQANITLLAPDELMKTWTNFGTGAAEQFRKLMTAAAQTTMANAGMTGGKSGGKSGE